ncbi:MAG: ester cyclase [Alphaproteobacteria bacterium]
MTDRAALQAVMDRFTEDIWNNRRLDVVAEVFKADATVHLEDSAVTGMEAIRDGFMRPLQAAFPDLHYDIADLFFDGDRIAMRYIGTATHHGDYDGKPATDKRLAYEGIAIFRMDGNQIAEVWTYTDRAAKFAAL